jgi:hypothetical protein
MEKNEYKIYTDEMPKLCREACLEEIPEAEKKNETKKTSRKIR